MLVSDYQPIDDLLSSNESSSELTNSSNECLSNGADVCLLHSGS